MSGPMPGPASQRQLGSRPSTSGSSCTTITGTTRPSVARLSADSITRLGRTPNPGNVDPREICWAPPPRVTSQLQQGLVTSASCRGGGSKLEDLVSRQALLTAAQRLRNDRSLIVLTSRPAASDDGWDRLTSEHERCVRINLGAFSADEVGEIVPSAEDHSVAGASSRSTSTRSATFSMCAHCSPSCRANNSHPPNASSPLRRSLVSTTVGRVADTTSDAQRLASVPEVLNRRLPLHFVPRIASVGEPEKALEGLLDTGFVTWLPAEPVRPLDTPTPSIGPPSTAICLPSLRHDLRVVAADALEPDDALAHRVADAMLVGSSRSRLAHEATHIDKGTHMPDTVFMSDRIEVTRPIPARPAAIFDLLRSPAGHVAIDASGMLQDFSGEPAEKVGDTFVIHMDRESLNDVPLGKYDVTVHIIAFERDKEIAWNLGVRRRLDIQTMRRGPYAPVLHFYGYRLDGREDGVTNVTSYYDWSKVSGDRKELFPVVPESALRATLGILERTVRKGL